MGLSTFIIGLILAAAGGALTLYLVWLMLAPAFGWFRNGNKLFKFRKVVLRIEKADDLIEQQKYKEALRELKKAVMLDVSGDANLIASVKEHHQNVLSRCLIIAEECGSRAENIAEVEKLFIARAELQTLYKSARDSFQRFNSRRKEAGKSTPEWGKSDFNRRMQDIKSELNKNYKELLAALDGLFSSINKDSGDDNIIYH